MTISWSSTRTSRTGCMASSLWPRVAAPPKMTAAYPPDGGVCIRCDLGHPCGHVGCVRWTDVLVGRRAPGRRRRRAAARPSSSTWTAPWPTSNATASGRRSTPPSPRTASDISWTVRGVRQAGLHRRRAASHRVGPAQARLRPGQRRDRRARATAPRTSCSRSRCSSGDVTPRAGLDDLVNSLYFAGVPVAVVSTGARSWVDPLVRQLIGDGIAETVVTPDDLPRPGRNPICTATRCGSSASRPKARWRWRAPARAPGGAGGQARDARRHHRLHRRRRLHRCGRRAPWLRRPARRRLRSTAPTLVGRSLTGFAAPESPRWGKTKGCDVGHCEGMTSTQEKPWRAGRFGTGGGVPSTSPRRGGLRLGRAH